MNATYSTGIVLNGRVELQQPLAWPEGTEVIVMPSVNRSIESDPTSEEIAQTLAAMENILPFDMSDEELANWEAERRRQREFEKANFESRGEAIGRNWE